MVAKKWGNLSRCMIIFNNSPEPEKPALLLNPTHQPNLTKGSPMETAVYKNRLVDVSEFLRQAGKNFKDTKDYPTCPICKTLVFPSGHNSFKPTQKFSHFTAPSWCPLSNTDDSRYKELMPSKIDLEQVAALRENFMAHYRDKSYRFCKYLHSSLNRIEHNELVQLADRQNIWAYKGVPAWAISYILLLLMDFEYLNKENRLIELQFQLVKPKSATIDGLWLTPNDCQLAKTFRNSSKLMLYPEGNPYPVSSTFFFDKSGE